MECHHRRLLYGRVARSARRVPLHAQRRDIVCDPAGCHRRSLDRVQPHDGRQHEARRPSTTARCWRYVSKWGRWHGRRCIENCSFAYVPFLARACNVRMTKNGQDGWCLFGWLAYTVGRVPVADGVGTLLSFCAIFISISAARLVQQLAVVSGRRRNFHDISTSNCSILGIWARPEYVSNCSATVV